MCPKHLCQVWHPLGYWGSQAGVVTSLPRLCTPAGLLAPRKLLEGCVSCHISGPVSPVCAQTYLGHELRPGCELDILEIQSWLISLVQLYVIWPAGVLTSTCELYYV